MKKTAEPAAHGLSKLIVKGAREHNLKNIDIELPRDKLIVISGLSGSGKSSLAFDTIFAEGQRRYVESLSAYARQFLGRMDKPDIDYIEGLSPAISIEQKTTHKNPRSTVGTVTRDLRLLPSSFCAHRSSSLSAVRKGNSRAIGRPDHLHHSRVARRDENTDSCAGYPRQEGRAPESDNGC